jgi:predicted DNA-binding protein (UPF0251 family)
MIRIAIEAHPCASAATGDHQILEALAALREGDREALLLCAWEGLSTKEAAAVVGCSAATFAIRLHRARGRVSTPSGCHAAADRKTASVTLRDRRNPHIVVCDAAISDSSCRN